MYWFRDFSAPGIALYFLLSLGWIVGGWLLVNRAFRLRAPARLVAGLATGLLLFITLSNLLANLLPVSLAFWGASILIFLSGALTAWLARSQQPAIDLAGLKSWPQVAALLAITLLFTLMERGLAIFDEYLHLPLISVMAAGDIPPHFYLDPVQGFAYHYGLQVLSASLVRQAGFFPWSAWDISRALAIALTLVLGWNWVRQVTRSTTAAYLGAFLFAFGGGARWLLLLAPPSWLLWMSGGVQLSNTGAIAGPDLFTVLSGAFPIEGGGPFPLPFAFYNGILVPVTFALANTGAMAFFTVILLLILASERRFSIPAILVLSLIFASLALSAEHLFVFFWAGIALAGVIYLLKQRFRRQPVDRQIVTQWAAILLLSGILSVVQGGFLTEAVRNILYRLQGISITKGTYNYFQFLPQWPPALVSGHLGKLSLLDARQLFVLLAEAGPAFLLAPVATLFAWRRIQRRDWLAAGLGLAGAFSLLVPLFFSYGVERSSTRLPATALWIWLLLGFPLAWEAFRRGKPWLRLAAGLAYGIAVFSGVILFAVQLISVPYPQITYFINATDARLSQQYWNRLPAGSQVLDPEPERSVALFGYPTHAYQDFYHPWPDWGALISDPNPAEIAGSGYSFVYMDKKWWQNLGAERRQAFSQPCVKVFAEQDPGDGDFRKLLDVSSCQ